MNTLNANPTDLPARVLAESDYADEPLGIDNIELGQHVAAYSRGRVREAVVSKIGRKNVTVTYTTQGAIDAAHKIASRDLVAAEHANRKRNAEQAAEYRATADAIDAGVEEAPSYADAAKYRKWADDSERRSQDAEALAKAEAEQARPYMERVEASCTVTSKSVPADKVFALVD